MEIKAGRKYITVNGTRVLKFENVSHRNARRIGGDSALVLSTVNATRNGKACAKAWVLPACRRDATKPILSRLEEILTKTKVGRDIARRTGIELA